MLEHLHARDHVEGPRPFGGEILRGDEAIVDVGARFHSMKHGDLEGLLGQVDAGDRRALRSHGLGEDAAAASYVHDPLAGEPSREPLDVREAQRVDLVQRPELARGVPPAMRERTEFGEFRGIEVRCRHADRRLCHQRALSSMSRSSIPVSLRPSRRKRPSIHEWVTCSRPAA